MIYLVYSNDPLAQDLGGGAEHLRGLHRALRRSGLPFHIIGARLQQAHDPDVTYVSTTSSFPRFYLGLWRWFWRNRRRIGPDDLFHFHRNYAAWPKLLLCPGRGRVVITYHNVSGRVLEGRLGRLASPIRRLMLLLERRVAALADAIICVSGRDRAILEATVARRPFAEAAVIPAAFDARLFETHPARPPEPAQATRLLFLGRLSHQKNPDLAIATLERLAARGEPHTLTIAGDGEEAPRLRQLIAASPARDRVRWLGRVPHDRVPALLAEHGILLLTSRYEASPTVVKEALLTRRAVVTTDVGDVALWLTPGRDGLVCPADPDRLAEGVLAAGALIRAGRLGGTAPPAGLAEQAIMARVLDLYRRLAPA